MTEKHYGDARVDADQLDRRVRVADREPTGNPPGCGRRLAAVEGEGTLFLLRGSDESGRPRSNRRRPAWEAFSALAGQGSFGGGSRNGIRQYTDVGFDFPDSTIPRLSDPPGQQALVPPPRRWHAAGGGWKPAHFRVGPRPERFRHKASLPPGSSVPPSLPPHHPDARRCPPDSVGSPEKAYRTKNGP